MNFQRFEQFKEYKEAQEAQPLTFWDLDGTLYSNTWGVGTEIGTNMQHYMVSTLGFPRDHIKQIEYDFYKNYGNTLRALRAKGHPVDLEEWFTAVHKPVLYSGFFKRDDQLRQIIQSIPGRHVIFTNADPAHAETVLELMGIRDCFEKEMVDIYRMNPDRQTTDLICKPDPRAFDLAMEFVGARLNIRFLDDSRICTQIGKQKGWYTVHVGTDVFSPEHADACLSDIHAIKSLAEFALCKTEFKKA
jgi:pyrimidine 5'-nucleotidase